ncbi:ABC transporter substrate-binding protein [Subtercola endophyticus]|uniref:ABC transporter substrate-binding protein n=1 Tax=Subtercola endophyticus TaxID=2895559 RepID=UPI001E35F817|nr:ABC transporter substrate-binding protein [Subtercola endophyticus]UFS58809.1 ABC transporter substrate-binding protein [Subtercola endophyticus]
MKKRKQLAALVGLVSLAGIALSGCASSSSAAPAETAAAGAVDLSGSCPATVVIQTNWNPESEHGTLYQLLGPNPTIDASKKIVSGPLYSKGLPTGVNVEIRTGGPAIGYQTASAQMYADPSIMLGYVDTAEAIQDSSTLPTTAVFAQFDVDPSVVLWDPATYPNVKTISDLAKTGANLIASDGSVGVDWMSASGLYPASQITKNYDGTAGNFVADGGKSGQTGYATSEPYTYAHDIAAWDKPVDFQLFADAGWPSYANSLAVRTGDLSTDSACLSKLVPVLQQADVDYYTNPAATNALIQNLVTQYNTGWVYGADVADYAAKEVRTLNIASDGTNGYVGDFDDARVTKMISIVTPILAGEGVTAKSGLAASDIYTNQFIDQSIGFGK